MNEWERMNEKEWMRKSELEEWIRKNELERNEN